MFFIIGTERQTPDRLIRRIAGGEETLGNGVVIGEDAGARIAQRDQDRPGQDRFAQGNELSHGLGLLSLLGDVDPGGMTHQHLGAQVVAIQFRGNAPVAHYNHPVRHADDFGQL